VEKQDILFLTKELRMGASVTGEILRVLEQLPDPRGHNIRHKLMDILTIALWGVIWLALPDLSRNRCDPPKHDEVYGGEVVTAGHRGQVGGILRP
jgi:hypothetical protein